MRRSTITAVLVGLVVATLSAAGTSATTGLGGSQQAVIVTLRDQADVSGLKGTRLARLQQVIGRKRALADRSQKPFLALAKAWQRAGRVSSFTPLWIVNGFALTATPDVIEALRRSPAVASVSPDATMYAPPAASSAAVAEWNVSRVNAPALWDLGITGQGVVVASLDSGVDATHPDLAARWRGGTNSWYDPFGQHPSTPVDLSGHGTQVTGIMVGGDAGGTSIGVAPGARWIAARIYNDQGQGTASNTHLAFQWLLDPDHDPATADAPQVVNSSWTYGSFCNLEFAPDIQALRAAGIDPVFAAGNYGSVNASPANNPGAFAVGATRSTDAIASYSSRGPSACGEPSNLFPELTAPGDSVNTSDLYASYTTQSGTSLAAPHVAGALALLLSAYPGLSVSEQETALETGAVDLGASGPDNTFGYGRLDVLNAYNAIGGPSFALDVSPSSASTTAGGSVSYTVTSSALNGFAGDVTLAVSGLPAQATSSVNPALIAGGTGSSQVTVTTGTSLAAGSYPFTITGTSGSINRTVNATLVVAGAPDFAVTVAPASATTAPGGSAAYTVAVMGANGFTADVGLTLTGLTAAQGSWSFTPTTVTGGSGSGQLIVTTAGSLSPGTYPLTVTGAGGGLTRTAPVTLIVTPPPTFTLTANPTSITVEAGTSASYTVSVSPQNGFGGNVSLALTGLTGTQATWAFAPGTITGGSGSSVLTVTPRTSLNPGSYPLTITGTSGALTRTANITLVVQAPPPPDFALSVSPASLSVRRGSTGSVTVTVTAKNGFASSVTMSLSGTPSGVTASFSPNPVVPTRNTTLVLRVQGNARTGTYALTVKGVSGSKTHTAGVTLRVT